MLVGEKIQYNFPEPVSSGKEFITGEVLFINETKTTILCEDKSVLVISFKNYDRIEKLDKKIVLS